MLSCGADNAARMYDLATGQPSQVAQHEAPIKCLRWIDAQGGILATGSWDKTVKVRSLWFKLASLSFNYDIRPYCAL